MRRGEGSSPLLDRRAVAFAFATTRSRSPCSKAKIDIVRNLCQPFSVFKQDQPLSYSNLLSRIHAEIPNGKEDGNRATLNRGTIQVNHLTFEISKMIPIATLIVTPATIH
jgi:hypothetical protein